VPPEGLLPALLERNGSLDLKVKIHHFKRLVINFLPPPASKLQVATSISWSEIGLPSAVEGRDDAGLRVTPRR
jgi:hypothetical protein